MKKIIIASFLVAFGAISVQAQEIPERKSDGFKPHENHKMHDKKQMAELNLTDAQKAKMKELNQAHQKQMEELRKQDNITVKESIDKMESIRKEHHEKVQSILTADQKAIAEKNKAARTDRMGQHGGK